MIKLEIIDMVLPCEKFVYGYNKNLSHPARAFIDGLVKKKNKNS